MPLHIPGYNYCGPGTKDFSKTPVNTLDNLCRWHDLCYSLKNWNEEKCDNQFDKVIKDHISRGRFQGNELRWAEGIRSIFQFKRDFGITGFANQLPKKRSLLENSETLPSNQPKRLKHNQENGQMAPYSFAKVARAAHKVYGRRGLRRGYSKGKYNRYRNYRSTKWPRRFNRFKKRFRRTKSKIRNIVSSMITPPVLLKQNEQYYQANAGISASTCWALYDLSHPAEGSYANVPITMTNALYTKILTDASQLNITPTMSEFYNFTKVTSHYTLNFPVNFDVNCQLMILKVKRNPPANYQLGDLILDADNFTSAEFPNNNTTALISRLSASVAVGYDNVFLLTEQYMTTFKKTRMFNKYFRIKSLKKFKVPASFNSDLNFTLKRKRMFYNKSLANDETADTQCQLVKGDIFPIILCRGQLCHTDEATKKVGWPKPVILWHVSNQCTYWPRTNTVIVKRYLEGTTNVDTDTTNARVQAYAQEEMKVNDEGP